MTQTAGSAARYYFDAASVAQSDGFVDVPTAVAYFPHDMLPGPRSAAERWYRIERWTQFAAGGHFGPWEQPAAWSADVIAFFDELAR